MRIVYGVHGYGQGHATRALAVLAELTRRHDVVILAGGDAYEAIHREHKVTRIPTLGYYYRKNGTRSNWLTFKRTLPAALDLIFHGPVYDMVADVMREFQPHVVVSDAEAWTHRVARDLRIPRIGFDHFGILAHCRAPMRFVDRIISYRDAWVYRQLVGQPDRVLVSSFYDAPPRRAGVKLIPTLLREEVFTASASRGEHMLAYFNKGEHLFSKHIAGALQSLNCPVLVYGTKRLGSEGNLEFRPRGNRAFLEALASCRAVISTAGNQLVGEALHFGKPMLVIPEDCVEQRLNASAVERLGIGMQIGQRRISPAVLQSFLAREQEFRANVEKLSRNGQKEALAALEQFFAELADPKDAGGAKTSVA